MRFPIKALLDEEESYKCQEIMERSEQIRQRWLEKDRHHSFSKEAYFFLDTFSKTMPHVFFMLTKMRRDEVKLVSPSSFPGAYFTVIPIFLWYGCHESSKQ